MGKVEPGFVVVFILVCLMGGWIGKGTNTAGGNPRNAATTGTSAKSVPDEGGTARVGTSAPPLVKRVPLGYSNSVATGPVATGSRDQLSDYIYHRGYSLTARDLDMVKKVSTKVDCCRICGAREGCEGWTFIPMKHRCYLKAGNGDLVQVKANTWITGTSTVCEALPSLADNRAQ